MSERVFYLSGEIKNPFRAAFELAKQLIAAGGDWELVLRNRKSKRSIEQNRRLWALYREVSATVWVDGRQFSDQVWHEWFKGHFIGCDEIVMPDGEIVKRPMSTAKLSVGEMSEYQSNIERWCAEQGFPVMVD